LYKCPCEWVYMSIRTLHLLQKHADRDISGRNVSRYAKRHGQLVPKTMHKVSWRIMVQVMPREVARFIQSMFGELKMSEARYEDLLSKADEHYPKYLEKLKQLVYSPNMQETNTDIHRLIDWNQ